MYTAIKILGLNQVRNPSRRPASSSSSKVGSCDKARAPDSRTAGIIRALAYITNTRYARDIMTEGVIVITAATTKLKAECMLDGRVESACSKVVYDAIMIGGSGGRAG